MATLFVYCVNGSTFEDTTAFGDAWKKAKAMASEEHTIITRQVVIGNVIRNDYYTGGIFLDEKFMDECPPLIF